MDGIGNKQLIEERVEQIKQQVALTTSEYDKLKIARETRQISVESFMSLSLNQLKENIKLSKSSCFLVYP